MPLIHGMRVPAMSWDGTRAGISRLCKWVNEHPTGHDDGGDPLLTYVYQGGDDVQDPLFALPEGDYATVKKGDLFVLDQDEFMLYRPVKAGE